MDSADLAGLLEDFDEGLSAESSSGLTVPEEPSVPEVAPEPTAPPAVAKETGAEEEELDLSADLDSLLDSLGDEEAAPRPGPSPVAEVAHPEASQPSPAAPEPISPAKEEDELDLDLNSLLDEMGGEGPEEPPTEFVIEEEGPKQSVAEETLAEEDLLNISEEDSQEMLARFEKDMSNFITDMELEESSSEETDTQFVPSRELQLDSEERPRQSQDETSLPEEELDLDDLIRELEKASSVDESVDEEAK